MDIFKLSIFCLMVLMALCFLNTAATLSPEEGFKNGELDKRLRAKCPEHLKDDALYHCVTAEEKKYDIKKEIELQLGDRSFKPVNISNIPREQLEAMLKKEGFDINGSYENNEDNGQYTSVKVIPYDKDPVGFAKVRTRSYFNLSHVKEAGITEAKIHFFVKGIHPKHSYARYVINGYRFRANGEVEVDPIVTLKRKRSMSLSGEWDSLVVTDLAKEWAQDPQNNFGIMIKVVSEDKPHVEGEDVDVVDRDAGSPNKMFVEVYMTEDIKRTRRSVSPIASDGNCHYPDSHPDASCCRFHLEVSFAEFGWDWIIAPQRYNAYYCSGKCKYGQHQKHSYHAYFMEKKNRRNMCCSPERLAPMKIIYMSQNDVLNIRIIDNMIVTKCGCA